jgi:hypothetical protein
MHDGPISFLKSWEGFLPPNTVVMARRTASDREQAEVAPTEELAIETFRVAFEAPGIEEPAARELLQKIASALSLTSEDYYASAEPAPRTIRSDLTIRFVASEAESSGWQGSVLSTYSLSAMLAKPDLKKAVWAQLKSAPGITPIRKG